MNHPICFGFQVATPEVNFSPDLTCLYGDPEANIRFLRDVGYDAVEFMSVDPKKLDAAQYREWLEKYNMRGVMVCTGEVFGTLGWSFLHPDEKIRRSAIERVKDIITFASVLGANVNIGRVRGCLSMCGAENVHWAESALQELCCFAASRNVDILVEPIEKAEEDYINTVADGAALRQRLAQPNLKVMMDYCAMSFEETDVSAAVKSFVPDVVSHIHLSEPDRWFPGHTDVEPFCRFFTQLSQAHYRGPFVIEVLPLPDQKTAAEKSFENIAPLIDHHFCREVFQ